MWSNVRESPIHSKKQRNKATKRAMGVEVGENGEGLGLDKIWIGKGGGGFFIK